MADILKTLESWREPKRIAEFLRRDYVRYYFSLGRGKPKQPIEALWFTHRGQILGCFRDVEIVQNVGQLPPLKKMDGSEDSWQIKPDAWVAICTPPFHFLRGVKVHHEGFRGWRYFDFVAYLKTMDAKIAI